jgi:hypothetical protein
MQQRCQGAQMSGALGTARPLGRHVNLTRCLLATWRA